MGGVRPNARENGQIGPSTSTSRFSSKQAEKSANIHASWRVVWGKSAKYQGLMPISSHLSTIQTVNRGSRTTTTAKKDVT